MGWRSRRSSERDEPPPRSQRGRRCASQTLHQIFGANHRPGGMTVERMAYSQWMDEIWCFYKTHAVPRVRLQNCDPPFVSASRPEIGFRWFQTLALYVLYGNLHLGLASSQPVVVSGKIISIRVQKNLPLPLVKAMSSCCSLFFAEQTWQYKSCSICYLLYIFRVWICRGCTQWKCSEACYLYYYHIDPRIIQYVNWNVHSRISANGVKCKPNNYEYTCDAFEHAKWTYLAYFPTKHICFGSLWHIYPNTMDGCTVYVRGFFPTSHVLVCIHYSLFLTPKNWSNICVKCKVMQCSSKLVHLHPLNYSNISGISPTAQQYNLYTCKHLQTIVSAVVWRSLVQMQATKRFCRVGVYHIKISDPIYAVTGL